MPYRAPTYAVDNHALAHPHTSLHTPSRARIMQAPDHVREVCGWSPNVRPSVSDTLVAWRVRLRLVRDAMLHLTIEKGPMYSN